ncbi:MAG: hypothetical protein ACR2OZ_01265 [Verrucomicrobiales bacterium]
MATVYRSSRAEIDLLEIWEHVANDDPLAAVVEILLPSSVAL